MPLFYGTEIRSRLLLGTARYSSPAVLAEAVRRSRTDVVTVSLRRETAGGRQGGAFFELIRELGVRVLPNTAGCHSVAEAVLTAKMARDGVEADRLKL
ncbi:thiazole synthase, partial [Pseudomonas syringae]